MDCLQLQIPEARGAPLTWVARVVFCEMLSIAVKIDETPENRVQIRGDNRSLVVSSVFPRSQIRPDVDLGQETPDPPLRTWDVAQFPELPLEAALPVLFGQPRVEVAEREIRCGIDIFGAIFFMLSRFEEVAGQVRDHHGRFPATASLAWRAGFLYRPLVDEYVELLWALMKRLWPSLSRKRRCGAVAVSCDVDYPFDSAAMSASATLRAVAGDLYRRRSVTLAVNRVCNFVASPFAGHRYDPNYTFSWYMDMCERFGHRATFFFIAGHSGGAIDGHYELEEPRIRNLLRALVERGHEIGLHGSYNTYRDGEQLKRERARLKSTCADLGIECSVAGNRQHFLRWDPSQTPDHLEDAGIEYDATGSYADRPGFRYGTSHPFPMWSWRRMASLRLRQRPLVVMESSVIRKGYLGLGYSDEALQLMLRLKRQALRFGGDFTLLWHNSHLLTAKDRRWFSAMIDDLVV